MGAAADAALGVEGSDWVAIGRAGRIARVIEYRGFEDRQKKKGIEGTKLESRVIYRAIHGQDANRLDLPCKEFEWDLPGRRKI